jgi:hypothetical protein
LYGNIPLVAEEITGLDQDLAPTNQGTTEAVYDLIINDLSDAEALPASYDGVDVGRATSGAAKAMLAKVYLTRSQMGIANEYELALQKVQEVTSSGEYMLLDNYMNLWDPAFDNSDESIFAYQAAQGFGGLGQQHGAMTGVRNGGLVPAGGWSSWTSEPEYFDLFDRENDERFNMFVLEFERNGQIESYPGSSFMVNPHFTKYYDQGASANRDYANDMYILRYADVLLMESEILNELDPNDPNKLNGVNAVRQRAGLDPITMDMDYTFTLSPEALSVSSADNFRKILLLEREMELGMEQHGIFDYRRFGLEYMQWMVGLLNVDTPYEVEERHMLYPIPQRELDIYGSGSQDFRQNVGY